MASFSIHYICTFRTLFTCVVNTAPTSSTSPSSSSVFFSILLLVDLCNLSFRKAYIFRVIYYHLQYGILLPCSPAPLILAPITQVSLLPPLTVLFISRSRYDRQSHLALGLLPPIHRLRHSPPGNLASSRNTKESFPLSAHVHSPFSFLPFLYREACTSRP